MSNEFVPTLVSSGDVVFSSVKKSKDKPRVLVTGDPYVLKDIISDANKLSRKRIESKKVANEQVEEALRSYDSSPNRVTDLMKKFISMDPDVNTLHELENIIKQLLELREAEPNICTIMLFCIAPFMRLTVDQHLRRWHKNEFCSASLDDVVIRKENETTKESGKVFDGFRRRLSTLEDSISRKAEFEEKQVDVSAVLLHHDSILRCRICEELIPEEQADSHFSDCLVKYKRAYQVNRLTNVLKCLKNLRNSAPQLERPYLEIMYDNMSGFMCNKKTCPDVKTQLELVVTEITDEKHSVPQVWAFATECLDILATETKLYNDAPIGVMNHPTVDDFDFLKPISRGSVGRVFLAAKKQTGDLYAMKVMKKKHIARKNLFSRIMAERNVLARANCPFVVKLFFSFETCEKLFLAMEFVQGGDLLSLLNTYGRFPESIVVRYTCEIAVALKYLHENLKVCHRDLKPDNILVDGQGHLKLTDFGLSYAGVIDDLDNQCNNTFESWTKRKAGQNSRKLMRSQVGTPDYMAPEILLGLGHSFSCDWWSLGIMVFEMLFGIPPFNDDSPELIFSNILACKFPPPCETVISDDAWDLINELLVSQVETRLGTGGAFEVQSHPFFKDIEWHRVETGDLPVELNNLDELAFMPHFDSETDTSYFDLTESMDGNTEENNVSFEGDLLLNIDFRFSQVANLQTLNMAAKAKIAK